MSGSSGRLERAAFWITVLLAAGTLWLTPRLPLADLPQHAGQVQLWHDLVKGTSKWAPLLYVHYFTPYLAGSALALLLSFVVPVALALKLVLLAAYCGFVAACILMRRELAGDPLLDCLFIPGFFGLAYLYGFFPFLVALPVGMAFIAISLRYARRPTPSLGLALCAVDVALFASHGLVFLFANAIGVAFLVVHRRVTRALASAVLPYVAMGALCGAYFLSQPAARAMVSPDWPGPVHALSYLLFMPMGAPGKDWSNAVVVPLLLCVPLILGSRVRLGNKAALVPLVVLLLWLLALPETFLETFFAGTRFAVFFLPFYALLFERPARPTGRRRGLAMITAGIVCLGFIALQADRMVAFARESAAFDEVLAAAEPGFRARQLIVDMASPAARSPMAYQNFALWYQVDKGGLVDFNFAAYGTQVIRYRPLEGGRDGPLFRYRYVFVRADGAPAASLADGNGKCRLELRKQAGSWMLFENTGC